MERIDRSTRIIFLDIDGVMNNSTYFSSEESNKENYPIDPDNVENLNNLIQSTNSKIVISSSWRVLLGLSKIEELLAKKGFIGEIIGQTIDLYKIYKFNAPRGVEIKHWIENNIENPSGYRRYIIIDDDSDMLLEQKDHFILTDFSGGGLTVNAAYRAKRTLLGLENIPDSC